MKIRTIISDRSWEYRLHVKPHQPGQYFVKLHAANGAELKHAPITGSFATIDEVIDQAEKIYLQLVAMFETKLLPTALPEPVGVNDQSGHPGIDQRLE